MSKHMGMGVVCPSCDGPCDNVVDSRKRTDHVWRRRRCIWCGELVTTREVLMVPGAMFMAATIEVYWGKHGEPRVRVASQPPHGAEEGESDES